MAEAPSSEEVRRRLAELRAKRGYLLPHHGLLAIAAPELLAAYDATYTALTLTPRRLGAHDKEFVWLVILVATDEALASHHIAKFRDAGGADGAIELAVRLAGHAAAAPRYAFPAEHWQRHLPGYDRARAYRAGLAALTAGSDIAPGLVEMAMAAAQICRRGWWELAEHIKGAYGADVAELDLAEAIQLTMFPASVPNFVEACAVWRDLIASGAVPASPAFKLWADTPGQGGFDEASRR